MTSIEERHKLIEKKYYYLYLSSHYFLIPVFASIYTDRYDLLWISLTILVTSILRWGEPNNTYYQYIDSFWVKFLWFYFMVSFFQILFYKQLDSFLIFYCLGLLLSIPIIYILGNLIFQYSNPLISIPIHMLVHFYTIICMLIFLCIPYDHNTLLYSLFLTPTQRP